MAITQYVRTSISVDIGAITRESFGNLIFIKQADEGYDADRVKTFSSIAEVETEYGAGPEVDAATAYFSGDFQPAVFKVGYKLPSETYADALDSTLQFESDFYAIAVETVAEQDILDVAGWAENNQKLFLAKTDDSDVLDSTETNCVASQLLAADRKRTALVFHSLADGAYPEIAWAGNQLTKTPGSTTWAFKEVPTIPADKLTSLQINALKDKRVNFVDNVAGRTFMAGGYTSKSGFYIDVIRGLDYVVARMNEDLFDLLTRTEKIPGDDRGSAMVESVIWARLKASVTEDIFVNDDDLSVTVPTYAERSVEDRENRLLTGCKFTANIAGAVHEVEITGEVRA